MVGLLKKIWDDRIGGSGEGNRQEERFDFGIPSRFRFPPPATSNASFRPVSQVPRPQFLFPLSRSSYRFLNVRILFSHDPSIFMGSAMLLLKF